MKRRIANLIDSLRKWAIVKLGGYLKPVPPVVDWRTNGIRKECEDLSREQIIDVLSQRVIGSPDSDATFMLWYAQQSRVRALKALLNEKYQNPRDAGHMIHFHDLNEKVKRLKHEITTLREVAEYRNKQMEAVKYIVYCTGCEAGGPSNKDTITEEEVCDVETIARRLRAWWENVQGRREMEADKAVSQ